MLFARESRPVPDRRVDERIISAKMIKRAIAGQKTTMNEGEELWV
jgi:hypothetical protein